jgi:hypothetical protein
MQNLAGSNESDLWCAKELADAGIPIEVLDERYGEPQTRVIGRLGGIEFRRFWYYWSAGGKVPLAVAVRLYQNPVGRKAVRVAGHCGCPPPEAPWVDWFDGDEHVVIDPDGSEESAIDRLIHAGHLTEDAKPRFAKSTAGLQGYVMRYHIDSAEGLRLFADAVRGLK